MPHATKAPAPGATRQQGFDALRTLTRKDTRNPRARLPGAVHTLQGGHAGGTGPVLGRTAEPSTLHPVPHPAHLHRPDPPERGRRAQHERRGWSQREREARPRAHPTSCHYRCCPERGEHRAGHLHASERGAVPGECPAGHPRERSAERRHHGPNGLHPGDCYPGQCRAQPPQDPCSGDSRSAPVIHARQLPRLKVDKRLLRGRPCVFFQAKVNFLSS